MVTLCLTVYEAAATICHCFACAFRLTVLLYELNTLTIRSGGPLVFSALSNVILMLRVHALYNRGRGGEWTLSSDDGCANRVAKF